jgi:hypothetical protein
LGEFKVLRKILGDKKIKRQWTGENYAGRAS